MATTIWPPLKIAAAVVASGAVLALAAWWAEPLIPVDVSFQTEDADARAQYEKIVISRGFTFHHDKNVSGETVVVVEGVTPREYLPIDCAFFAWDTARARSRGVVVYDRPECVL